MSKSIAIAACLLLGVAGCTTVPSLEDAQGIPIHDVVQRVKCEMSNAFDERTADARFAWMSSWTAKVDLTLEANEQGGITPLGAYTQPLRNAYPSGIGPSTLGGSAIAAVQQNFTFGFGASLQGQAVRTEVLSFSLSLKELKLWRDDLERRKLNGTLTGDKRGCDLGDGADLQGGLGLKQWIDSALEPVGSADLQFGDHVPPNIAKPQSAGAGTITPRKAEVGGATPLEKVKIYASQAADSKQAAMENADEKNFDPSINAAHSSASEAVSTAKRIEKSPMVSIYFKNELSAYALSAVKQWRMAEQDLRRAQEQASLAKNAAENANSQIEAVEKAADDPTKDAVVAKAKQYALDASAAENNVMKFKLDVVAQASAAAQNAARAKKKPDPPIDSLSQSVEFVVTTSAGASPSWNLVQWKGPTASGTGASLSKIRSHILNIAMGPPGVGSKTGEAQAHGLDVLGNQNLITAVRSLGQ